MAEIYVYIPASGPDLDADAVLRLSTILAVSRLLFHLLALILQILYMYIRMHFRYETETTTLGIRFNADIFTDDLHSNEGYKLFQLDKDENFVYGRNTK